MESGEYLKLMAFDTEDLSVISAHVQDADAHVADMAYLPASRRFVAMLARPDWSGLPHPSARIQTGIHFDHVEKVSTLGIERNRVRPLRLLAVTFQPIDAPSGIVTLTFDEGIAIRLHVECLDAQLRDVGALPEASPAQV